MNRPANCGSGLHCYVGVRESVREVVILVGICEGLYGLVKPFFGSLTSRFLERVHEPFSGFLGPVLDRMIDSALL